MTQATHMASELKNRTKAFGLPIIRLVESLPKTRTASVLGTRLLRCGTSVGANYRASTRARSRAEFISKLGIVEEEADEAVYRLELMVESGLLQKGEAAKLPNGYRLSVVYLKLFEKIYAPLTAGLFHPLTADKKLPHHRRTRLDRLYTAVVQALDNLVNAVGLTLAA